MTVGRNISQAAVGSLPNPTGSLIASGQYGVDPEQTLANMTRADYNYYLQNIRPRELELIDRAQNDTSLIDQAKEDRNMSAGLLSGVEERNRSRYGAALTPAQLQQQQKSIERETTLAGAGGVNNARVAQKDANRGLMADLINIGQGVNRASMQGLSGAAQNQANRNTAYENAKSAYKAQTTNMIGTMGAAAIFAFM